MIIKRRDIYFADLTPVVDSEQGGLREKTGHIEEPDIGRVRNALNVTRNRRIIEKDDSGKLFTEIV